ncbi:hypothetical protein AC056_03015 [Acinetobacter genomosp. 33YU]|uniref:hypothetical protein n=1 Tax=Acinetobacter TaxID=469 RepID=UPI00097F8FD6|nr:MULTISPECIES: hypothetical protein [Acinetobacter]ONN51118.1 hypothetical protein AC056_03015 [Acinetobacter genomosp. 33YU]OUC65514.1 hypothetical protein MWQ_04199 [Acinetobacter seifertii]PJG67272.1 hypothetical protein CVD09_06725 [Acinetobacter seifertii]QNX33267.1 hypothetical protein IC788_15435 [Acinetobacter seifertii]
MVKKIIFFLISFISFFFSSVTLAEPLEEVSEKYANCLMGQVGSQIKMNKDENDIVEDAFYKCRQEEKEWMGVTDIKKLAGDDYKNISEEQLKLISELQSDIVKKMKINMTEEMLKVIREERKVDTQ